MVDCTVVFCWWTVRNVSCLFSLPVLVLFWSLYALSKTFLYVTCSENVHSRSAVFKKIMRLSVSNVFLLLFNFQYFQDCYASLLSIHMA